MSPDTACWFQLTVFAGFSHFLQEWHHSTPTRWEGEQALGARPCAIEMVHLTYSFFYLKTFISFTWTIVCPMGCDPWNRRNRMEKGLVPKVPKVPNFVFSFRASTVSASLWRHSLVTQRLGEQRKFPFSYSIAWSW